MIRLRDLTKLYNTGPAVMGLTFDVHPGRVTGFLGPNGAGKSTTMRMILGLDQPTRGAATVNGRAYRELDRPLCQVGALLNASAVHRGRSASNHLLWMARSNHIPARRVEEVLALTGLTEVAGRRVGAFSLGMAQRLGIAGALLGDPGILVLDEPVNGLDTEGIRWIRDLLRSLAAEGRTVLISSHHMIEMQLTADHVVVIGRGRLLADTDLQSLVARHSPPVALVRSPELGRLAAAISALGRKAVARSGELRVEGMGAEQVGELASRLGIPLHGLTSGQSSLEDVYTGLVGDSLEFSAGSDLLGAGA